MRTSGVKMSGMRTVSVLPVLAVLLLACGGQDSVQGDRLLVLAASSLQFALPEIVQEFERRTDVGVDIVLGSSGNLVAQIENGAPGDLFLSADRAFVDRLESEGHVVPGTKRDYATGRIAIVVPPGRRLPEGLGDLAAPEYAVVALANPESAPYGLAAKQALESAGLWTVVAPKVVFSESVAQAAQFVRTENADAGIIALSVVLENDGWEHRLIDPALHVPIIQAAAVIAGSAHVEAATELRDLITSPDGVAILAQYGFGPAEEP